MKRSEFKKRYDPNTGKFTRQHIQNKNQEIVKQENGEEVINKFKPPPPKPLVTQNKRSGDKIVKMLTAGHKK